MMKLRIWFWKPREHLAMGRCNGCQTELLTCADCNGDFLAGGCRSCQLGLVCPTHDNYWI